MDLPAALGVDFVHCELQADIAVQNSDGALQKIQGDLITESYFDSLAVEVNEMLKVRRQSLAPLASRQTQLAADVMILCLAQ